MAEKNLLKVRATELGFFGTPGHRVEAGQVFICPEELYSERWMEIVEGKLKDKKLAEKRSVVARAFNALLGKPDAEDKPEDESEEAKFRKQQQAEKIKDESGLPSQHGTIGGSSDTAEGAAKAAHDVL